MLVRALPGWAEVEADAVAFVVVGEDRLLLALDAPDGTQAQPLTLGSMQVSSGSRVGPQHSMLFAGDCEHSSAPACGHGVANIVHRPDEPTLMSGAGSTHLIHWKHTVQKHCSF